MHTPVNNINPEIDTEIRARIEANNVAIRRTAKDQGRYKEDITSKNSLCFMFFVFWILSNKFCFSYYCGFFCLLALHSLNFLAFFLLNFFFLIRIMP